MKSRICTCHFLDSLLIFIWLCAGIYIVVSGIVTVFPVLANNAVVENGMLMMTLLFCIASASRFLEAYEWNSFLMLPIVYGIVFCIYWVLLYVHIIRTRPPSLLIAVVFAGSIAAFFIPGLEFVWKKIKPRSVARGAFIREQMRLRQQQQKI